MELVRRSFILDKNWWFVIPTISIVKDNLLYREKNISIEFHFLCFHARIMLIDKEQK